MRRTTVVGIAFAGFVGLGALFAADAKYTIKEVMQKAHSAGLLQKVKDGGASKAEKEQLIELYTALGNSKPPRGDEKAWKAKVDMLVAAAREVATAKTDAVAKTAVDKLDMASNCAGCHNTFRRRQGRAPAGDGKYSVSDVMQTAHAGKDGERLIDKVWTGKATKAEKDLLVELYTSLPKDKPVTGDLAEWKEKTEALLAAAKGVASGEKGAESKLGKLANCQTCHTEHRGR